MAIHTVTGEGWAERAVEPSAAARAATAPAGPVSPYAATLARGSQRAFVGGSLCPRSADAPGPAAKETVDARHRRTSAAVLSRYAPYPPSILSTAPVT
ncbi:hypothetical protein [Streptomyces sp. NPDC008139]|uniref:hypothetical protein n=1 Tax=Streptomyces sp. NPDC008139 TaxID=3364814 RepID=UPI0036EB4E70